MTIMVAGGLTFAIPGMEPAEAAQISSNPNLEVSAEGQNADNEIGVTNIVQVTVFDELNSEDDDAPPKISVDGIIYDPYQGPSGAWYLYFADNDIKDAKLGFDWSTCIPTPSTAETCRAFGKDGLINGAVDAEKDRGEQLLWLLDLKGEFEVVYKSQNDSQVVTLEAGNPDVVVSLDRSTYPRNTDVVITIDDQALNVDPTNEDEWWFADDGTSAHTTFEDLQKYLTAVKTRQTAYDTANTVRSEDIDENPDPRVKGAELLKVLQEDQERADEILSGLFDEIFDDEKRKKEIVEKYGQGERNSDKADSKDYKGTLQTTHEENYGRGTMDSTDKGDNYQGSKLEGYLKEDKRIKEAYEDSTVGTNGADKNFEKAIKDLNIKGTATLDVDAFNLNKNTVVDCVDDNDDCIIIEGTTWVKFTETDFNSPTFDNTKDDKSSLKTTMKAQRGLSFSVTYDNTVTAAIGYSTVNITIDAGDQWNSGQEIGITLTDSDANTNSQDANDLDVTNSDQIIPTIEIGDPFTLGHLGYDETSKSVTLGSVPIATQVTEVSDILVFKGTGTYGENNEINIDLGTRQDVNAYLPANHQDFKGMHILNYDVSALENVEAITLKIEGEKDLPLLEDGVSGSGTYFITDTTFDPNVKLGDDATKKEIDKKAADQYVANILYDNENNLKASTEAATLVISFSGDGNISEGDTIIIDIFAFGLEDTTDPTSNVNDAIYRLELEEDGDNSSNFTGTLEYIGLNQINILDTETYTGIETISDSIILISDDDSISVEYLDLDSTGGTTLFTAEADTPTHSGLVKLDSDGYKVADTVTVTVTDADLNVDSGKADVYTTDDDKIGSEVENLFTVSIDGKKWVAGCKLGEGLDASQFTLRETGNDSGVFTGTFSVPAKHCPSGESDGTAATVTGTDISVEYTDFRDDSGSIISVSASAGIRSNTGSVSLDRTVYPVPISAGSFETHEGDLGDGSLTVYVSINDSDYDTQSNGIDTIEDASLEISILRSGVADKKFSTVGDSAANAISETAPNSGIFEHKMTITATDGPAAGRIMQGDILHVVYEDPSDASGSKNTVTDSATFDLRNGVLQSDQTVYIIGSDAILTLIEPDLNLDSDSTETYTLDLIEWDSDAGTCTLAGNGGDCDKISNPFAPTPSNLLETGSNTGIFQVVVSIPADIDGESLQRGEEITLTYNDWGPSGSNYVGDKDEEVSATIYTSNFGATIELDQRVYTWTDKVYITVVAPDHNIDGDQVDEIGNNDDYPVRISTRGEAIEEYKLVETGADTGIFTGEVILTGFPHDADGDQNNDADGDTSEDNSGPTDGRIGTESESGISVSFKFSDGETVSSSALIRWNVGEVQWLEASYPASGSGIVRIIDPDMNLNPEAVDNFDVTVWSDTDGGGIDLTVTETNAATGIFEGTVFFGVGVDTSGHRLRVVEGDTVTAQYYDNTLPAPFKETERLRIGATTLIGTIVPPLERAPISDLRAVDSFGNTLDVISVDSQIQLESDITNGQDKSQEFAYLIQVQDDNGVTVSLNWITGSLTEGQSLSPAVSWTPTEAGTYDVTAFVWESIENPTALSPTATIAITVN